jgi:hypothetical protein
MNRMNLRLAVCLCVSIAPVATAADSGCQTPVPLTLRVRFADEAPREVLLQSGLPNGLRLLDPVDGRELWSAGVGSGATQQIAGMDAAFGSSLMAVHLDEDGLHDRLYAGDRTGRLWRFDLRAGALPRSFLRAGVLADLRAPGGGRGFLAAPDIARIETVGTPPWLNIAIGTASTGAPRADHRFYVLRDDPYSPLPALPMTEADLELVLPPLGISNSSARGYYLSLGSSQVLAQSLTVNGRIHYTAVEHGPGLAGCDIGTLPNIAATLTVTIIRAADGALTVDLDGNGRIDHGDLHRPIPHSLPANTAVALTSNPARSDGRIHCQIGGELLPECSLDTRPQRTWWRREDAD